MKIPILLDHFTWNDWHMSQSVWTKRYCCVT